MSHHESLNKEMRDCIALCADCANTCLETFSHCVKEGKEHVESNHLILLQTCADVCQTSVRAMSSGSDFHNRICEVCAEICEACAESCEAIGDDTTMKKCASICRECAQSCREMGGTKERKVS